MNLDEFQATWVKQEKKLDDSIRLSKKWFKAANLDKSQNRMQSVLKWRIVETVVFFAIVVALWQIIANDFSVSAASISATTLLVFAIIGLAGSIGQIALIKQIDYSGPVKAVQEQIYAVRAHSLKIATLTLLSIPFYMAYIFLGFKLVFDVDLYAHIDQTYLIVNIIFRVSLIVPTAWFVSKLNTRNIKSEWVRLVARELGGRQLLVAAELLSEIHEFEKG
jgi:hypothetical protein